MTKAKEKPAAPKMCDECGRYPVDYKGLCAGCIAYQEHTGAI